VNVNTRTIVTAIALVIASTCLASTMHAQPLDQSLLDKKVKVTAPTLFPNTIKGRVSAIPTDTLVIEQFKSGESSYLRVPIQSITRCQVQNGKRSHVLMGALVGTLAGGITAAIALHDEKDDTWDLGLKPLFATSITLTGTGLGALAGLFIRTDRYEDVPQSSLHVGLGPIPKGGLGVSLSLSF
jgi:hypothetical protein